MMNRPISNGGLGIGSTLRTLTMARAPGTTGITSLYVVLALAVGSCSGPGGRHEPTDGGPSGHLPPGYAIRIDRENRDPANFIVRASDRGLQLETGPAGIIYRPDQVANSERYTVRGRFTEIDAPVGHREGFGLFIGGQDLEGPNQRYTYFLVRADGRYLVKHRNGASAGELSDGWEVSEAVRVPTSRGDDVTNELAIVLDGGRLRFSCNGELVTDIPIGEASTQGVVGVRVNHNLEVRVQDLSIDP